MNRIIWPLIIMALSSGFAFGGETRTISVSNAVDLALANDHTLKQMGQDVKIAEAQAGEAGADFVPEFNLSANVNYLDPNTVSNSILNYASLFGGFNSSGLSSNELQSILPIMSLFGSIPPVTNAFPDNYQGSIGFNYPLPIPFTGGSRTIDNFRLKMVNLELMRKKYEDEKKAVVYNTLTAFYNLFLIKENIRLTEDLNNSLSNQLKNITVSYQKGAASEYDMIKIEVQYKNNQPRLIAAKRDFETAKLSFAKNIGLSGPSDLELIGDLLDSTNIVIGDMEQDRVLESALTNDINYLALGFSLKMQKLVKGIADETKYPTIAAFGNLSENYEKTNTMLNNRAWEWGGNIGLGISMPINEWIPGSKTANASAEGDANLEKTRETIKQLADGLAVQVDSLLSQIEVSRANIVSSGEGLNEAKLGLDIANERYATGSSAVQDIIDAQASYTQAQANWLQAIFEYYTSVLKLKRMIGEL